MEQPLIQGQFHIVRLFILRFIKNIVHLNLLFLPLIFQVQEIGANGRYTSPCYRASKGGVFQMAWMPGFTDPRACPCVRYQTDYL